MSVNKFHIFALIAITTFLGYWGYKVMQPFLVPLAWAGVLSLLFYPVHVYLMKVVRWKSVSAVLTLIVILLMILGPFSYITFLLAAELNDVAGVIKGNELNKIAGLLDEPVVAGLAEKVKAFYKVGDAELEKMVVDALTGLGQKLLEKVAIGAMNVMAALINMVFMSLAIFFFLRDGPNFVSRLRDHLPFKEHQKDRVVQLVRDMVVSTVFGGVVVALIQGLLGGVSFYFLDVPSPVIWGTAISIMSFVPMLGTFSIWGPIVVYLFLKGAVAKGFILLAIGIFGISMVDNILKPIIIGGRTKMPTLLIFFSVLGGIKLFGFIGLIMGPLSVALFIAVLGIFKNIEQEQGGADAQPQ